MPHQNALLLESEEKDIQKPGVVGQAAAKDVHAKNETIGEKFAGLWKKACSVFDAHAAMLQELRAMEQSILPTENYMCAVNINDDHAVRKMKVELARDLTMRLVRYAEKNFAPIGGKLTIDESEFREKFEYDDEQPGNFSLKALWEHLEQTYGGQAGEDEAWRQTAAVLIEKFSMNYRQKEVVKKAGRTILEKQVWLDDGDKKFSGKNRLGYTAGDSVATLLRELRAFATWYRNIGLANDLGRLHQEVWYQSRYEVESRKQYVLGDDKEIILVTYHNKFEFRFSDACAAQLQLFLGTYGKFREE